MKKLSSLGATIVVGVVFAVPLFSAALTVDDIQQQIANLLAQITQLQDQLRLLKTPEPVRPIDRVCPRILRALNQGISGSDVKELQAYLGVSQTGYFGPMTARAVAAFQAGEGLTQVGIVGPQTRAAFARRCGWGNQKFNASPTSGQAPLSVWFTSSLPNGGKNDGSYSVDFGDGSTQAMEWNNGKGTPDAWGLSVYHTYKSNGTYFAKLIYQPPMPACPTGMYCAQAMPAPRTVGTVTITVGTTNTAMFTASPTGGQTPLTVAFQANLGHSSAPGTYRIDFGDGQSGEPGSLVGCAAVIGGGGCPDIRGISHTYTSAGAYTAKLHNSLADAECAAGRDCSFGTVTITVGGSFTQPCCKSTPTLQFSAQERFPGYAQAYLSYAEGSDIYNTNSGTLYKVGWGDGSYDQLVCNGTSGINGSGLSNATSNCSNAFASHTYTQSGTYTVTLFDNAANSVAKATVVINKSATVNTSTY